MTYNASQVAFVDTETTGLDPERHKVWEVAVIVDGVEHCWQQRFTPGWHTDPDLAWWLQMTDVDQWVLANTWIRERFDYRSALEPLTSIVRFIELTKGRHLVGACPWFDSERMHRVLLTHERSGPGRDLPWHYHLIDVENLAVGYMMGQQPDHEQPEGPPWPHKAMLPWKSTELSLYLGINPEDFEPKHTALADARWAKAMFEAIMGGPQ